MYETATTKVLRLRTDAARKARVALTATLVAAALMIPPLVAGLMAPPASADTTFLVTNTNDSGAGSLRQAILDADNTAGPDVIDFAIPGPGVHTISPQTGLPPIISPVTINGFSQTGSAPNTLSKGTNAKPTIELNGSEVTGTFNSAGLIIRSSDVTVTGLAINRFGAGVFVNDQASNALLTENFIGTDPTGTQDLGNGFGVIDQGFGTFIGGPQPDQGNLISGNDGPGVSVRSLASNTAVSHDLIGTDKTGTKRLGNSGVGVEVAGSSQNSVQSNTIAFNGKDGVRISNTDGIRNAPANHDVVSSNSVFANGGLGINLINPNVEVQVGQTEGATANDPGDADLGPNGLQNKPGVSSAKKDASGTTTIKGKLNSHPNEHYTIEFFKNPKGTNEGKTFLFSRTVSTDGAGNVSFTFKTTKKIALGQTITATAGRASTLDTSEFSVPRTVASV